MSVATTDPPFPLGVATACFVYLDDGPNPSATSATDAGGGKVAIDGRPHEVDGVYDSRLDKDEDVYQEILQVASEDAQRPLPLVTFVEDAVSICAIFTGTNLSAKRLLYEGPDDADDSLGILGWIFDPLFQLLRDKAFGMQGFYEFDVDIAFYEIFDENITDLLRPESQDLQIKLHPVRGFEVEGLSRHRISTPHDGCRTVQAGKRNRKTQVLPSGPAQESASAVLQIALTQREGESQDQYRHLYSMAQLVEAPSTHKLVSTVDDLRLTQGPTLNRSLLAYKEVAKALASEKQIRFAPFAEGKLTEALQISLGGNAIVLILACFSRSDSIQVNTATMAVVQHLQEAMHYPVSNTELIQGLVLKYQFMLANSLEGRGGVGGRGAGAPGADGAVNAQRMRALEGQVLQAKMESNESKEDAAKVYKMLELFKGKYVKLVESKSTQSRELIASEEDKLDVSRSLLDLKLEHSKLLERFETDRYALTTDLLAAKNEVVELEMRVQDSEAVVDARQRESTNAVADRESLQEKVRAANKKVKELQEGFGIEEAKSIEMGAELLTLVNQKTVLEKVRGELERQVEEFSARLRRLELDLRAGQEETRALKHDADEARKKADILEVAKAKAELDLQRAQTDWEKRDFDTLRSKVSGDHDREAELLKNHINDLDQLTKVKVDNEDMRKKHDGLREEIKQSERRLEQSEKERNRKARDLSESQRELQETNQQLDSLRAKHRETIDQLLGQEGKFGKKASRRKRDTVEDRTGDDDDVVGAKRAALEGAIASYRDREEKARSEAEVLKEKARDAMLKNRALFDRYKQLRGVVEDSVGEQRLPPDLPPDDQLVAEGAVAIGTEMSDTAGNSAVKERLKQALGEVSAEQEEKLAAVAEYAELVKNLEKKQRQDAKEVGRLQGENQSLTRQLESLSRQRDNTGREQEVLTMQAMMEKLAEGQKSAIQEKPKGTNERVRQAEEERDKALDKLANLQLDRGTSIRARRSSKDLAGELERAQRRIADLVSKNSSLSAELKNFQVYMRDTTARYQATIGQLQEELRRAKGGLG